MIDFTDADLDRFLAEDPGGPVVMLNLLSFRPDGGFERYMEYVARVGAMAAPYGLEIVYAGAGGDALAAEDGQAWDAVALVRYPDRASFAAMVRDPAYQAVEHLRTGALVEAVLQPTTPLG